MLNEGRKCPLEQPTKYNVYNALNDAVIIPTRKECIHPKNDDKYIYAVETHIYTYT